MRVGVHLGDVVVQPNGDLLGHADRQFQRQGHDRRPQADPRCLPGDLGQEDERPGKTAFVFMKMVLGDPGRIEATALGMEDLLGGQPVALRGVRHIEHAGEETQALRLLCCRHSRFPVNRRSSRRAAIGRPPARIIGKLRRGLQITQASQCIDAFGFYLRKQQRLRRIGGQPLAGILLQLVRLLEQA